MNYVLLVKSDSGVLLGFGTNELGGIGPTKQVLSFETLEALNKYLSTLPVTYDYRVYKSLSN